MLSGIVNGLTFASNSIVCAVCPESTPLLMARAAAIEKISVLFMWPHYFASADDVVSCIFAGLKMIFCARQAEISDTNS